MDELSAKNCVACKGDVPKYDMDQIRRELDKVPGWSLVNKPPQLLERKFLTKTYAGALKFVMAVSTIAEEQGHHPDVSFGWGYATIRLMSHASDGLTENDFIMAAKISAMATAGWTMTDESGATRLKPIKPAS